MKSFLHAKLTKIVLLALSLNLVSAVTAFAALNGSYTINASGAATATNYKTFASAVSDMASGTRTDGGPVQGSGVSAAVTFTVAAGTYNEQLTVPAITGASAINTITFDGQNPANCTLFATPNGTYEGLVTFNTCSYVTVKNLNITTSFTSAPYDFGVAFVGTASATPCNNNTLQNCNVSVPIDYSYFNYQYALTFVGGAGSGGDGLQGYFNNNTVTGCTLSGGNWDCVFLYGNNGFCAGNVIKNNTISGGIVNANVDIENVDNIKFLNNYINSLTPATSIALYFTSCIPTATDFVDISGNTLNVYSEGMYISANPGTAAFPMRISNNFIYSTLPSATDAILLGGYSGGNSYVNVYHNSLNFSMPCTGYPYHDDGSNNHVNINDNIFSYSATSGAGFPFNLTGSSAELTSFNNNIFYNAASSTTGSVSATPYTTSAVGGGSFNTASFTTNPNFVSATNLHIQSPSLTQVGANVGVTTDIDGQTRPNPPHIGADDFATGNSGLSNDLSTVVLTSPGTSTLSGSQTITVQVYNTGSNTVSTGNVNYVLNGGSVITQALPSSLASGANTSFSFTTPANLLAGLNTLKIYTSLPNGVTDANTNNDTISITWYSALSGTYTINGSLAASATNFVSFTSASSAVNNGLVTGPVVINVAAATYTEQIEFTAGSGTSATNTVTFNGGSAANVTLQYSGSADNQHTIRLNGCSYINFTNMTITTTNTSYGWPVHFLGSYSNHNRFANCNINVPVTASQNLVPIIATSNLTIASGENPSGVNVSYNRIDTCIINKGTVGIDWYGTGDNVNSVGNIFQGNTITNATGYGMFMTGNYSEKIWNNTITMANSGTGIFFENSGISGGATPDFMDASFNIITGFTGGQSFGGGIAEGPLLGSASVHNRMSNNIIVSSTAASNAICLDSYEGSVNETPSSGQAYTDIDFNTFVYQGTGTGSGNCVYLYNFSSNDNNSFNNNICAVLSTIGTPYPVYTSGAFTTSDYNIFYTTNANTTIFNNAGTPYTAGTVITGGGFNAHSQVTNPNFVSGSNFHVTAQCPRGLTIAGITTDIDGDTRYNPPTIGADEIPAASPIATPAAISGPTTPCQGQGGYVYSIPTLTNATSYIWTLPTGATITAGSNTNSITVTFSTIASPGNFTVEGSSSCGGGPVGAPYAITLNPAPTLSSSLTPPAFCTGTPFSYTPTSATGGATFSWSRALIGGISNAANSGSNNPNETLNLTAPTGGAVVATYAYTINSPAGCSFSQNVTVTVNNLPTISFTNLPIIYGCAGGAGGTFTASGASTYAWSPTSTLNVTSGASVIASPTSNTTYTVTGTNANGCVNTNTAAITVVPAGSPLNGAYTIDPGPVTATNFQSFSSAIATLNCLGASGAVTFTVTAGQTFTEQPSIITYTNSSHFPIKFITSNSAGTDPVLSVASGTAVLEIDGGNNYTFDGIDFTGTTASTTNGLFFKGLTSSGCQNNVVQNCKLSSTTTALIRLTSAAVSSPTANSNNSFFNNTLTTSQNGIVFTGVTGFPDNGNVVGTNTAISAKVSTITAINVAGGAAIIIRYQTGFAAYKNTIDNTATTVAGAFTGILFDQDVAGTSAEIYNNKILSLTNSGAGTVLTGIQIAGGNGIFPTVNIYGNTMGDATHAISSTSTGIVSAILAVTGIGSIHDNVLFGIASTGGAAYGICEATSANAVTAAAYDVYNNTLNGNISSTTGTPVVGIAVNTNVGGRSVYNNNISNVKITSSATASVYGIFFQGGVASVTNNIYGNNINTVSTATTTLVSPAYGINVSSASLASITNNVNNNSITSVTSAATTGVSNIYGIYVVPTSSTATGIENIDYNTVNTVAASSATGLESVYGIFTGVANANSNIFNNKIYTIKNTTTGTATVTPTGITAGLHIAAGVTNTIYNNMIYDIESYASVGTTVIPSARGISINAGTTNNVYYNTVFLSGTSASAGNYSAAFFYTATPTTVLYNNNIFDNLYNLTTTGTKAVAIFRNSAVYTATNPAVASDYNLVYAGAGAKNYLFWNGTTAYQTFGPTGTAGTYLNAMAAIAGGAREAHAANGDPVFVSIAAPPTEDVHINLNCSASSGSPVLHAGEPITTPNINFDFDGNARNSGAAGSGTAPAIGADEVGSGAGAAGIITGPTAPLCAGLPVTFNVPAILNATSYNWVFPSTTSLNTTTSTPTVTVTFPANTASGIQTVTVQGITTCGNGTVSSPFPVSIIAAPTAFTVTPAGPSCLSATIGLSNSQTNTVGYQLLVGGVNTGTPLTGISGAISFGTQSSTGTYTVVATSGAGCTASMSNATVVAAQPTMSATPISVNETSGTAVNDGITCSGDAVKLVANVATGASPFGYAWSSSLGTSQTATVSPTTGSPSYTVTVTDNNGCTVSASKSLTVNALPALSATPISVTENSGTTANDGITCSGDAATLSVNVASGASPYAYAWSGSLGTNSTASVSPATGSPSYSVTVTDHNGCTVLGSKALTVNALPSAPTFTFAETSGTAINDGIICTGDALTITASSANGYSWSPGSAVTQSITVSPSVSTTYSVTITDINACTASGTSPVTVNALPSVAVSPSSAVCLGGISTPLAASGASTYTWSPATNLSATTGVTVTAQISQLTFYTVTGTDVNQCSKNVIVPVATVATGGIISPAFSIICSGNTKTLTVKGAAGHDYQWQISTDNTNWTNIPSATNTTYTTVSSDGNTNKFYRLMAQSNSCWNVASTTAEVDVSNPTINVTATNITDNSLTLNWSPTGTGNYSISYSGTSSATQTSVTPAKTITGLTASGTYSITVTQTGIVGCSASGVITGVHTLCAMPTGVTLSSPTAGQLLVSWTGVPGGDYRVYYRPLFSATAFFTKDVINSSSVLLTKQGANNLYGGGTYEVFVSRLNCPNPGDVGQGTNPTNVLVLPTVACSTPVIDSVKSTCPVQIEIWMHPGSSPTGSYNIYLQRVTPTVLAVNSYGISSNYFTVTTPYSGETYLIAADSKCTGGALSALYVWPGNITIKPLCTLPSNLVISNPTCHGFTASWNSDQCISNSASDYQIDLRRVGTINYNSYNVPLPANGIGPHETVNWLSPGNSYQIFVRSVYTCNGFATYGPNSQVQTVTTLSSGCREDDEDQPQASKPATQQYSADNQEVFSLYPNPNSGEFTVDLSRFGTEEDAVRIEVINMIGQTVITHLTTISGGHMSEFINLPNGTAAGTYIVRLTAGKNVYTAKINVSK